MDKESKLEEEIPASFERGEWESVADLKNEIARYASLSSALSATLRGQGQIRSRRICLRGWNKISLHDLHANRRALEAQFRLHVVVIDIIMIGRSTRRV